MMDPGKMDYLVVFEEPGKADNGYGGTEEGWVNPVTADASFRFLRGGETVQASRLAGKAVKAVRRRLGSQAASRAAKQSAAVPGPFDAVFRRILGLEVAAISRGLVPTFGLTVFCVAEKR